MGVGVSKQLKVAIGLVVVGLFYGILAGLETEYPAGLPIEPDALAAIGIIAFLLGAGMYLGEVISTWGDGGKDD